MLGEPFVIIHGVLQSFDGVVSVKAARVEGLDAGSDRTRAAPPSHDFH